MINKFITLIFLILCFCSCKDSDIKPIDLEKELKVKYDNYLDELLTDCKERAEIEAELQVDSIIDRLLKKDLIDTIAFPERPIRPERPADILIEK